MNIAILDANMNWTKTSILIAGTGSTGSGSTQLEEPNCIYIDINDTIYICDSENDRIQKWSQNAGSGVTVVGSNADLDNPLAITFDKDGSLYVADTDHHRVKKFPLGSTSLSVGIVVAGQGGSGSGNSQLQYPSGIAVDDNLNLYVSDSVNKRVMKYTSGASSGTIVIESSTHVDYPYGIVLRHGSSNQLYLGDRSKKYVQLWTSGASVPNSTVASGFNEPKSLAIDPHGNLYVTEDQDKKVWMIRAGSTTKTLVLDCSNTVPPLTTTSGIALDSQLNLYVSSWNPAGVYKFSRQ